MKSKIIFILLGLILVSNAFSQSDTIKINTNKIETRKVFGGYKFTQNGAQVNLNQLLFVMQNTPDAYRHIQKAKSSKTFMNVFGAAGGFCVGWTVGTLIDGGGVNWTMLGIGAGCLTAMIPFASSANKNALIAIDKYNNRNVSTINAIDMQLGFTGNGVDLVVRF